jgi:hypothetical protein
VAPSDLEPEAEPEPEVPMVAPSALEPEPAVPEPTLPEPLPVAPDVVAVEDPLAALTPEQPAEPEAPPSWPEILGECLSLSHAGGALLIDAQGALIGSAGEWPAAVKAVAGKLVPIMEKKQRESPGSSVALRLGKKVLSAWRLEMEGEQLTVGLLADAALPAEVHPEVESQIRRGQLP